MPMRTIPPKISTLKLKRFPKKMPNELPANEKIKLTTPIIMTANRNTSEQETNIKPVAKASILVAIAKKTKLFHPKAGEDSTSSSFSVRDS